jgi:hypothetical protein
MSDQENGLRQSPFADAWGTPDVGGQGLNGIGGGIDQSGVNGIVGSPFTKAIVPTPSGARTPDAFGTPPDFASLTDGPGAGSTAPWDITSSRNTVDKR